MMVEKNEASETGTVVMNDINVSLWKRYRTTPWGDLLRGRLSGRYDVDARIGESGLPVAVGEFLHRVMKKVGLRGSERIDVVDELIAHFRDGIARGEDFNDIIQSFGEVKKIAKLIRRAKKRNRSVAWRMWVRGWQGVGALVCLLVVWYVGALFYYFSGSVVISHDYLADITAKARAVPEGERAWPVYREALIHMKGDYRKLDGESYDLWKPSGEQWLKTVEFLDAHEADVALIRKGALMRGMGYVASHGNHMDDATLWPELKNESKREDAHFDIFEDTVMGIRLPQLSPMREMVQILSGDCYLAVSRGEGARVAADIGAMLGLARQSRETEVMISDLVSVSISGLAFLTLDDILSENRQVISTVDLQLLAHKIGVMRGGSDGILGVRIASERAYMYDLIQHIYTDDGAGGGHLAPERLRAISQFTAFSPTGSVNENGYGSDYFGAIVPLAGFTMANREEMRSEYDRWMNRFEVRAETPLWKRSVEDVDSALKKQRENFRWNTKYFLIGVLMPALSHATAIEPIMLMRRDGVLTAIALELWRRDHGGVYPEGLEELVPRYLPSVPIDRFNGKAMGYGHREDGRVVVYGVGADLDDDGGRKVPIELVESAYVNHWFHPSKLERRADGVYVKDWYPGGKSMLLPDGDWILWESGED